MQSIAIFPVVGDDGARTYRAVTSAAQSEGRTVGEALDGVAPKLPAAGSAALVVIQPMMPDEFFSAVQRQRLEELMAAWRSARDSGQSLSSSEVDELHELVAAELVAATNRSREMLQGSQR